MQNLIIPLKEIAFNLYWSWNKDVVEIFNEINPDFWNWSGHNPVKFLNEINNEYLLHAIEKKHLGERILSVYNEFHDYLNKKKYFENKYYSSEEPVIAYFSAEYGLTECMKIYSGGLGVLSGDHLKSSSDLGLPLIGIGLAYNYGYFSQLINKQGWQTENYELNEFRNLPLYLLRDEKFNPIQFEIKFPASVVTVQVWVVHVGNVKLYLLDTSIPENKVEDRRITDILYGGDNEKRISQEIVLGIGGTRLLDKLGFNIKAFHLNEGHSAFLCFERIKMHMKKYKTSFAESKLACYYSNIFTTHTPVPAGIDIFEKNLFVKYFKNYAENEIGISVDELFLEGDLTKNQPVNHQFNMAYLAINNSNFINGVSKLHSEVSGKMWNLPASRSSIEYITNGIHTESYLSPYSHAVYCKYFTEDYIFDDNIWNRIHEIPDDVIWAMRKMNKYKLIVFCREKIIDKWTEQGADKQKIKETSGILDSEALTIGFARRFAAYKRGNLIFSDLDRLKKILNSEDKKVQIIFSGKAHPKDEEGKQLISEIISFTREETLKNKIIFIDNYDLNVARHLVEGCDIWLNNPRRPLEASGTSGMKIIANGGLNLSIADGWWNEGYSPENGWKIESLLDESVSVQQRDAFEANSLYENLENFIIPLYYSRNSMGLPVDWIKMIKSSIKNLAGYFNTGRMVKEYCDKFYMKVK